VTTATHTEAHTAALIARRVALVTVGLLTAFALAVLWQVRGDILTFVNIGPRFAQGIPDAPAGGEGQFPYYIATEGASASAIAKMDPPPAFRYQRILYPALVAVFSFGQAAFVPYVMLIVNVLAMGAYVGLTAHLLALRGRAADRGAGWLALLLAVWMGALVCVRYNTTEPLAMAFSVGAVWCYRRERMAWAALLAAVAGLTKDSGLVLVGGLILHAVWERRIGQAVLLGIAAGGPYLAWASVLRLWLGAGIDATQANRQISLIPYAGVAGYYSEVFLVLGLLWVIVPSALLAVVALRGAWRSRPTISLETCLVLATAGFVAIIPAGTFEDLPSTLRYSQPFVVAALLYVTRHHPRRAGWLLGLWLPTTALGLAISFASR
jgi:hypothetical protein